ncbi:hypothetical protein N1851_007638 [Merluccius polli]|uniref:Uncharacterized protein n=1 Tax=Merluccius polli TaxID=89951 RepID=A0AA47N3W5_MERPO|nr:hypothetical protein N1851_007638 [Merluccius polli]
MVEVIMELITTTHWGRGFALLFHYHNLTETGGGQTDLRPPFWTAGHPPGRWERRRLLRRDAGRHPLHDLQVWLQPHGRRLALMFLSGHLRFGTWLQILAAPNPEGNETQRGMKPRGE